MSTPPPEYPRSPRPPGHLWVVGILLVLWNCWGLLGAIAAQLQLIPQMPAEPSDYFERQPLWFMLFVDLSPLAGVAGSIALLIQSRWAPALYLVQIVILVAASGYEALIGTSLLLKERWLIDNVAYLLGIFAAQVLYAEWLRRSGVLS